MTGRERLTAVLRKRPRDRFSWTTLVDSNTLGMLPAALGIKTGPDFYRHVGADVFLLSGWGTPHAFRSPEQVWPKDVTIDHRHDPAGGWRTEYRTPRGTLVAAGHGPQPVKYPVTTLEDLKLYRDMWEGAQFVARDDSPVLAEIDRLIGSDGVCTRFWGPSTIPHLLEYACGLEAFYYLYHDHRADMEGLIETMHKVELQAFAALAQSPCESVTLCENTSTAYISPEIYKRHNMPHQRDFCRAVQAAGKVAILHMCGAVRGLLPLIKETGCDGIHALTPPPTGDCPWEDALDVLGEDLVILGCLDPSVWVMGKIEDIGPALDRQITPRLRRANFVLGPMADGIAVPLERFQAIQRWVEEH